MRTAEQGGNSLSIRIVWHAPDLAEVDGLPEVGHISATAYLRLLAPDLLSATDPDVRRAVWVDGDVLVLGNLAELAASDLSSAPVGAVRNGAATFRRCVRRPDLRTGVAVDPEAPYFNSGVLVMDLGWWRAEQLGGAVLADLRANGHLYRFMDQDGLNAVFAGRWAPLDGRWNVQVGHRLTRQAPPHLGGVRALHFTSGRKPWTAAYYPRQQGPAFAEYRRAWFDAARQSGWFGPAGWTGWRAAHAVRAARLGASPAVASVRSRAGAVRRALLPTR